MGLGIRIMVEGKTDDVAIKLTQQVSSVEVYEKIDQPTQYKINFMVDICDSDIAKGLEEFTDPGSVLGILVEVKDELVCLVNGPVTKQEVHLQHGGAGSWLNVEGMDTSQLMDLKHKHKVSEGTDAEIIREILRNYPGLDQQVIDTPGSEHQEVQRSLIQVENDLSFIQKLGRRNGFHFWINYDSNGKGTAYFQPKSLAGDSANNFIVNLENNNIDNLRINWDIKRPTEVEGYQIDTETNEVKGGSVNLNDEVTLGADSLTKIASQQAEKMKLSPAVGHSEELRLRAEAALKEAQWFVNATCQTSLDKLCGIVRLHTVITITGAGSRHSGKYYVTGVKHTMDAVNHKMDVELARNAWGDEIIQNEGVPVKIL